MAQQAPADRVTFPRGGEQPTARRDTVAAFLLLAVFALVYLLTGLGDGSLENSDDGITASVLRGMARGRNLYDLTFQGAIEHQRPLLFHWIGALFVRVLGPNEFGLRLLPALCTAGTALLVFGLSRRLGCGPLGACAGGVLFLALWLPVYTSRRVGEDSLLAALLCGATLVYLSVRGQAKRFVTWGVLCGLAAMTKGTVALLAPLAVGADLVITDRKLLGSRWPWIGLLTAAGVAAPWHIVQTVRHGGGFWSDYLDVGVSRIFHRAIPAETGPWFYVGDLFAHDTVLVLLVALGFAGIVVRMVRRRTVDAPFVAVVLALAVPALLFSISRTRLSHYMLPAYPPLAALTAAGLCAALRRPLFQGLLAVVLAVGAPALRADDLFSADYAPSIKALAVEAQKHVRSDDALYLFDVYHTAAAFYSDRKTVLVVDSAAALETIRSARILARSHDTVRSGNLGDLAAIAAGTQRFCCISSNDRIDALADAVADPGRAAQRFEQPALSMLCLAATR